MRTAKCISCHLKWHISKLAFKTQYYICPVCEKKCYQEDELEQEEIN